jgi:hypothetical protein
LKIATQTDHIDNVIQRWKRAPPDYALSPEQKIGRTAGIMEHVDRAFAQQIRSSKSERHSARSNRIASMFSS